jgi:Predicted membrane protein
VKFDRDTLYHWMFDVGVVLKGLDGLLEVLGGAALLVATRPFIIRTVGDVTRAELSEDPNDFVANHLHHIAQHLSVGTQHFASLYLLGHGFIKLVLVAGLLRGWRWSFPAATISLSAFIAYQAYRLTYAPSALLLLLTILDVAIVALIVHEWCTRGTSRVR